MMYLKVPVAVVVNNCVHKQDIACINSAIVFPGFVHFLRIMCSFKHTLGKTQALLLLSMKNMLRKHLARVYFEGIAG